MLDVINLFEDECSCPDKFCPTCSARSYVTIHLPNITIKCFTCTENIESIHHKLMHFSKEYNFKVSEGSYIGTHRVPIITIDTFTASCLIELTNILRGSI